MTREEHVAWCKRRALEYVGAGELTNAVSSMVSDMNKRDDCRMGNAFALLGMLTLPDGAEAVRRWIEGFR